MHFVLLNQFYPPDLLPTGVMLEAVAEALVARGHEVTVVSGQIPVVRTEGGCGQKAGDKPSVVSRQSSVNLRQASGSRPRVVRLWAPGWGKRKTALSKVLSYGAYYFGVASWLLRRRSRVDVIVALSSPPYLSLLARMGAWWQGGHHAHWVMDLYPDVMVAHGMLRERSLGHRLLGALARWGMGGPRCRGVITLGPDMAERLNAWLPAGRPSVWVPLWGTAGDPPAPHDVTALRQQRGWSPETTVFLYSGNMGLGHRFTEVLEAMPLLVAAPPDRSIHLAYFGGGKRQNEIQTALSSLLSPGTGNSAGALCTVAPELVSAGPRQRSTVDNQLPPASLAGYVPQEALAVHLASGDVHLASLDPAWDGMMVPSKLQGIFAAGRPVLFTGSRTCSMGRWILESGGGWVVAPGDVAGHVQAMSEALDPVERANRGATARAFSDQWFDQKKNVARIVEGLGG
ncbi:MAG: glycosyltransferase family 4 protein [Verrucomicrobiota bacterium]